MTTPTHYRFEFDQEGRVVLAGIYTEGDLGPGEHRLYEPQMAPAVRGAIVPCDIHPIRAENVARLLIEGQDGDGS